MATAQKTSVQVLEEQRRRLTTLQERRTRAQVRLEGERKNLKEAQEEAQRLFGTSDLAELRRLYSARQGENDEKVMDFMMNLDSVEEKLGAIERQINF